MTKPTETLKTYWRSLEDHDGTRPAIVDEFPGQADIEAAPASLIPATKLARRKFAGILGASTALAGLTSTGCVRKPVENILPFAKRPEDLIPGQPIYYATAYQVGASVLGLLVESQDGRPTKVEGNPRHPNSSGATDMWAQGSVLNLYDPDRCRVPHRLGADGKHTVADWETVTAELGATLKDLRAAQGAGVALVIPTILSPTYRDVLKTFKEKFAKARIILCDPAGASNGIAGAEMVGGPGTRASYHLTGAKVIAAFDSDFIGSEQDHVRLQREYADGRAVVSPEDAANMSRLYAIEPHFTITGAQADHRLRVRGAEVGGLLMALANELFGNQGLRLPPGGEGLLGALPKAELSPEHSKFIAAMARDLNAAKTGRRASAVLVGERQPPWAHALAIVINYGLGNGGNTVRLRQDDQEVDTDDLGVLAAGLADGSITQVICLETNPAYEAPGELGLAAALKDKVLAHLGHHVDETGKLAAWCLPASHYLESWGDLEAIDSTISIVQPLIAPLHQSRSALEVLAWIATDAELDGYSLVQGYWRAALGAMFSDRMWRRWLHDGVVQGVPRAGGNPTPRDMAGLIAALAKADVARGDNFELNFHLDPKLADGRFANNGWLQEAPHPMTKLTWDNAAYISIETARKLQVENCDLLNITVGGRSLVAPVWIAPGQADDTVSLNLGYGRREIGGVANGAGVDAYGLQAAENPWFVAGAQVAKFGGRRMVYSTQDQGSLDPGVDPASPKDDSQGTNPGRGYPVRPIVRETTVEGFKADPDFSQKGDLIAKANLHSLWDLNTHPDLGPPALVGLQQWGMVIDLNKCTGCTACTVACVAENNIPVVGRSQVANGRELHWIRLDRYYTGPKEAPEAVVQPMLCQHCETAPCENVCPVNATAHSPEGLNDMAYNRCIGTRYCANNCPYKVRRFNFFNYNKEPVNDHELVRMVKNPDVTVRFRGVIEKCSYCVQRIQEAKIQAHTAGESTVKDGVIVTACAQVCPSRAIEFGDVADPTTRVSQNRASKRNYGVLSDLNTRPRTTYLARVRNPNPELV
ncbi:MAG: 4Fe-4S dicluster domain-containing protein [Nannocystis sp.]|nr:Fe-S-cluster-containing hydrogenase [Nannocystis sp.]MBA3549620.1 4Fe-4S dicluster domain-containing protein [Nannocystis sp.]